MLIECLFRSPIYYLLFTLLSSLGPLWFLFALSGPPGIFRLSRKMEWTRHSGVTERTCVRNSRSTAMRWPMLVSQCVRFLVEATLLRWSADGVCGLRL
jgi:hypothetical protein